MIGNSRLATRQLVLALDPVAGQPGAFLNGAPIKLDPGPRVIAGRTMLPLREVARVLGLVLENTSSGNGIKLGRLELYPQSKLARIDGKQVALSDVGALVGDVIYVQVRILEQTSGLVSSFDTNQRLLTLTAARERNANSTNANNPVARFATDKREYAMGEAVKIIEYSYDPNGLALARAWSGREEAYFIAGSREISLVVTNAAGKISAAYTVKINIRNELLATPRDFALKNSAIGKTFPDADILTYPIVAAERLDDGTSLIVSDSPEVPERSGLLYEDVASGTIRLVAHHLNGSNKPARILILASNSEAAATKVHALRVGETAATRVVATLGQVSLLDYLTANGREEFVLEPNKNTVLYLSPALDEGEGINLMLDLETSGRVMFSVFFVEESLLPTLGVDVPLDALRSLPILEPDGAHPRGSFTGAVRTLRVVLDPNQATQRLIIGDNREDPALVGRDALTGKVGGVLLGNYGVTYRIVIENAAGIVAAFSPRGGPYSGALVVNGQIMSLPGSGILFRRDLPFLFYRDGESGRSSNRLELEFIPASGSYLPINFIFYRLKGTGIDAKPKTGG
jgi:hypothetical protein